MMALPYPPDHELLSYLFANEVFMDTGDEYFTAVCLRLWTDGISPIRRLCYKEKSRWIAYRDQVWVLTELQPIETLPNFNKRGFTGWHLDHVLSIHEAFKRGLPPEVPACISNLRMIPSIANLSKGTTTVFTDLFNQG